MTKTTSVKVLRVHPFSGEHIEISGARLNQYTRYFAQSWTVTIGEREVPVSYCGDLEEAYQLWKNQQ